MPCAKVIIQFHHMFARQARITCYCKYILFETQSCRLCISYRFANLLP